MNIAVNFWAVLVSAVAGMVVGSIWYGPLFMKPFSKAMGMDQLSLEQREAMKKDMMPMYIKQFIASLVTMYVFAWVIGATNQLTVVGGLTAGFWVWFGFIMPTKYGEQLWGGKMVLFWIGMSGSLVTMLAAGAIIGAWG